jgi:serine/threonine protein kinase
MTDAEPAEHDSLLGTRIDGRYSVHRELGRGGMGVVYEGVHDDLGRPVAIKVLNLAWASDPTAVARFLREARTASSFSHPNIVDVTDLGRLPDGRPYLIMPKITGTDLAAMLTESGAQPAKRVAQLLMGVAAALDVIHAKGFVHRDIKPENLMYVVREDGSETVMLLDFGIAAAVMSNEPRLTGQGAIFGTPQFMPPEVCSGGMPDARGDVYALATVAFELITGVLPFGDDNMMRVLTEKLTTDPPTLSESSGVPFPAELEAVVSRGLARDPRERFAHASEFITALKDATDHAPVSWRSGVLRPSFRSAAHPVGSHPGAYPVSSRPPGNQGAASSSSRPDSRPASNPVSGRPGSNPISGRPGNNPVSGRPGSNPISNPASDRPGGNPSSNYPFSNDPSSVTQRTPSHPQRPHVPPQPQDEWSGRPSARDRHSPRPNARDYEHRPSEQEQQHWAARASAEDPWGRPTGSLGAGLRASERFRDPATFERPSGGKRVATLLGIAALLLGFMWYRHNRELGYEGRDALLPPSAAAPQVKPGTQPGAPEAIEGQLPPGTPLPNPNSPQQNVAPSDEPQLNAPGAQAAAPSNNAAALPPSGEAAEHAAANEHAAEAAAPLGAQQPSAPAAAPANAAPSAVPVPVPAAAALAAAKPNHSSAKPQSFGTPPAPKPSATPSTVAPEPPSPRGEPEPFTPEEPGSPVLRVQEEEPPPAEEEPDLPVRSPQSQAAQLAKDASTALLAGEVGHAIELLREATRLDPDQSLAWRTMGLAFERSGDTQAALAAYRQYIRLAPHGPQADMVRERMRVLDSQ